MVDDEDQDRKDWRDLVESVVYTVMVVLCCLVLGTTAGLIYGVMK